MRLEEIASKGLKLKVPPFDPFGTGITKMIIPMVVNEGVGQHLATVAKDEKRYPNITFQR